MATQNSPKILPKFYCNKCDYTCNKKGDYTKHINSKKHNATKCYINATSNSLLCKCGKEYKHTSSFYRHKKICKFIDKETDEIEAPDFKESATLQPNKLDPEIVKGLLMQNQELIKEIVKKDELLDKKDVLMEQMIQKMGTTNNITNNTQNNNFNINVFLNEQCKHAINFSDFIERIEVSHEDLENNAELGFVNGISKILMDNLKQLTLHERPIHCTDVKREIMYIKDDNEWQKEKEANTQKLNEAIKEVSRKSIISLMDWKKENPEYDGAESDFTNKCITIQQQSLAGDKKDVYYQKVMHNLAKESSITKT